MKFFYNIIEMMFLFASILCAFPSFCQSQTEESLTIDEIVKLHVNQYQFSGTVLVAKEGRPIYHQSFGYAYEFAQDSIQNDYHYSIASITKLFTSIRILQLVEKKKLSLSQTLSDFFPEDAIPNADKITLHHLLLHISGLPNEKIKIYHQALSPTAFVKQVLKNRSKAEFGKFNYNNLDYVFLGLIIEKVSNQSWAEEIQRHILDKLKMKNTGFLAYGNYPKNFAYSYSQKKGKQFEQDPLFYIENFYAAANMYSTSEDLLKLDQALYNSSLLSKEMYQKLAASYPEYNYTGYGVWNYQYPFSSSKPQIMERRGGILGANVVLVRLTDTNHTIIILSNNDQFNPDSFGDENNLREALIKAISE